MKLKKAIEKLAGLDPDFSGIKNGEGFARFDVERGHYLAEKTVWDAKDVNTALEIVKRYMNTQLSEFDYQEFEEESKKYQVEYEEKLQKNILDNLILNKKKTITFTDKITKAIKTSLVEEYQLPPKFWDFYKLSNSKELLKEKNLSLSKYDNVWTLNRWTTISEVFPQEIPQPKVISNNNYKIIDTSILFDYQQEHSKIMVESLIKNHRALDPSPTGTGKTYCSIFEMKQLGLQFFVICPRAVISSWRRSVKTADVEDLCLGIVNYEMIKTGKFYVMKGEKYITTQCQYIEITENKNKKEKYDPKYNINWKLPINAVLIFDEAHRCKNPNVINSQLLTQAVDQKYRILMLSATIGEDPVHMYGVSKALGFWDKPWEFYNKFCTDFGCQRGEYEWEFNGDRRHIQRLHNIIFNEKKMGHRMDVNKLIKEGKFPETEIIPELIYLNSDTEKIRKIYEEMDEELTILQETKKNMKNLPITMRQSKIQKVELLKVPILVEMTEDLIEQGHSVVLFVNFVQTVEALAVKLKTDCCFYGKQSQKVNERNRQRFQDNSSRVIICNLSAAREGIDLHDEHQQFDRVSIIIPSDSAQNLLQALGRVHRAGGTRSIQKILFAADTIEEDVYNNVNRKLKNIKLLNEGELNSISEELQRTFVENERDDE